MALLVLTNETHQLLWHDVLKNGQNTSVESLGYWIFLCYEYLLSISGVYLVTQRMMESPLYYRRQCSVILLAGLIPLIINLLFESGVIPKTIIDPTPFGFLASVVLVWWGLFRFRILDLTPLAYTVLMENMTDGMIVINAQGCIVELNRAACSLLAGNSPCLIGRPVVEVLKEWPKLHEGSKPDKPIQNTVVIHDNSQDSSALHLEVRVNALSSQNGHHSGYLLLLQDVSERHRIEEEREALVGKLQTALGQVKTLSGLLPICAGCKKVRNKADQWLELDTYLMQHTEAQLTHGLCPNCVKIYFPD